MSPKITNNIPLESLEHVESISTIINHGFRIQTESIFKIESNSFVSLFNSYLLFCPSKNYKFVVYGILSTCRTS
jgi:hypothetical protein